MVSLDDKLQDLLLTWEELREKGQTISAAELCRDCPELIADAERQIAALQAMDWLGKPAKTRKGPKYPAEPRHIPYLHAGAEPIPGYQLEGPLGHGGFGRVWKALGPGGVEVAMKFVPTGDRADTTERRALDAIKNIRHPHLLPVFGAWHKSDSLVIAMELADRTLLDRFLEVIQEGLTGIPGPELREYFREAAKGLDYLHNAGRSPRTTAREASRLHSAAAQGSSGLPMLQHCDIKPQNLFMIGGSVKVGDFGLARTLEEDQTTHSSCMTVAFAAPEFFDGKTTAWSDQYSLAITYCFLRGGQLPFAGTPTKMMAGHLHRPPDLSMVPENERAAVARALAKTPAERWPSCSNFIEALRRTAKPNARAAGRTAVRPQTAPTPTAS